MDKSEDESKKKLVATEDNIVPSTWEERDVRPRSHQNDCYYATLAGLLHTNTDDLEIKTGIPAKEWAELDEIKSLYDVAGLNGEFKYFNNKDSVLDYIRIDLLNTNPNMGFKTAIAYILPNQDKGHVTGIKAYFNTKNMLIYYLVDFQLDNTDGSRKSKVSLPVTNGYWLWLSDKRFYKPKTEKRK